MQAVAFTRRLAALFDVLELPELINAVEGLHGSVSGQDAFTRLDGIARQIRRVVYRLSLLAAKDPEMYQLAKDLGITEELNAESASQFETKPPNQIASPIIGLTVFLRSLRRFASTVQMKLEYERLPELGPGEELLFLDISDFGEGAVPLSRFQRLAEALLGAYDVLGQSATAASQPLRIVLFDSGSDLKLSLSGTAALLREVRALLTAAIDGLRHWRLDGDDRRLDSAEKRLRLLTEVQRAVEKGTISAAQAKPIRQALVAHIADILAAGAVPSRLGPNDEMERRTLPDHFWEARLLGPSPSNEEGGDTEETSNEDSERDA